MTISKPRMSMVSLSFLAGLALTITALPLSAYAAGDGDETPLATKKKDDEKVIKKADDKKDKEQKSTTTKKAKKKEFVIKCFGKNKVFDKKKKKCVDEKEVQSMDFDSIYTYGKKLAHAGYYEDAIRVLKLIKIQHDPRVLNYLGYSNRKLGNMDKALEYYHAAVAANPDFSLVREYLGEAYIQLGQLEKAREQLTQIERICGNQTCREYSMLSDFMIRHQLK